MRVLLTGGAGFVGSHIAEALLGNGREVRVLDSLEPQVHGADRAWPAYLTSACERVRGDVRDPDVVRRSLEQVDAVIHQAAAVGVAQSMYEISRYVSANALGAAVLLEAIASGAGRVQRMVVASSMSLYGEGAYVDAEGAPVPIAVRPSSQLERRQWEPQDARGRPLRWAPTPETKTLQPTTVYAITKRDHEELFLTVGAAYRIPTVALRYFNVYGPRQALSNPYTGVAAIFCSRLLNGKRPLLFEDGRQSRDFVHVRDVARANLLALECPADGGRVFNVGTGRSTSVRRVAELLAERLALDLEPEVTGQFRAGDIRHCIADPALAQRELGFRAEIGFEDGIDELIESVRDQKPMDGAERATAELSLRGLAR